MINLFHDKTYIILFKYTKYNEDMFKFLLIKIVNMCIYIKQIVFIRIYQILYNTIHYSLLMVIILDLHTMQM